VSARLAVRRGAARHGYYYVGEREFDGVLYVAIMKPGDTLFASVLAFLSIAEPESYGVNRARDDAFVASIFAAAYKATPKSWINGLTSGVEYADDPEGLTRWFIEEAACLLPE
jgi:hypothetical protein